MIRMILYMLAAIFAITLVRIFIGIISRGLGSYLGSAPQSAQGSGASPGSSSGRTAGARRQGILRKDSLTGIYIAEEIAVTKVINGQTHYFASEENLREYLKRAPTGA
jgi:YHS domain-containing protein